MAAPPADARPLTRTRWARHLFRRFERPVPSAGRTAALHIGLFLVTLVTTTLAGIQLTQAQEEPLNWLPWRVFRLNCASTFLNH